MEEDWKWRVAAVRLLQQHALEDQSPSGQTRRIPAVPHRAHPGPCESLSLCPEADINQ